MCACSSASIRSPGLSHCHSSSFIRPGRCASSITRTNTGIGEPCLRSRTRTAWLTSLVAWRCASSSPTAVTRNEIFSCSAPASPTELRISRITSYSSGSRNATERDSIIASILHSDAESRRTANTSFQECAPVWQRPCPRSPVLTAAARDPTVGWEKRVRPPFDPNHCFKARHFVLALSSPRQPTRPRPP